MARRAGRLLVWVCRLLGVLGSAEEDDYSLPTASSVSYYPEVKDGKCAFPFYFERGLFYDCIKFKSKHKWCSLNYTFVGYWKYCSDDDFAQCTFPFWYKRKIYWECTEDSNKFGRRWCSLTQYYNKERVWKYCDDV